MFGWVRRALGGQVETVTVRHDEPCGCFSERDDQVGEDFRYCGPDAYATCEACREDGLRYQGRFNGWAVNRLRRADGSFNERFAVFVGGVRINPESIGDVGPDGKLSILDGERWYWRTDYLILPVEAVQ